MPRRIGLATLALGLLTFQAQAVITADFPLKAVLKSEQHIVIAKVDKLDANPDAPRMILKIEESLKGNAPFEKLAVNLTAASSEGKKLKHTEAMLKRLKADLPLVVFASKRGNQYVAFAYTNGTWFQVHGKESAPGMLVWSFLNCEPYLRRTFKGTTAELREVVIDALAGKKEPPATNPKEEPGLGPEVLLPPLPPGERGRGEGRSSGDAGGQAHGLTNEVPKAEAASVPTGAPLTPTLSPKGRGGKTALFAMIVPTFAVIPTVAVGGPLAILAMLFPALFGKPQDVMRRWLALLSVASILSMLYLFWWGSQVKLWQILAGLTLAGAAWGWWRHRTLVRTGYGESLRPSEGEGIVFRILSVIVFGLVAYGLGAGVLLQPPFKEFLLMAVVVWAGTLGIVLLNWQSRRDPEAPPGVPLETMMLGGLALVCGGMAWALQTPASATLASGPADNQAGKLVAVHWTFKPEDFGRMDSTPLVTEDRVFIAAAHTAGFSSFGTVYCLDRASGKKLWEFNDDGAMKQIFSSPFVVGDRLFIGEGYHQHADCKLYCLNARTGAKLWEFVTMSHTESSPCVVDGKVYFGAGDDGVYCVDADSGKQIWHYKGLHVDTSPTVVAGRVYGGSGYGDRYYIFCLKAESGDIVWRQDSKLPVFGSPTVIDNQVFFGSGNGNMLQSAAQPAGALLCVSTAKGEPMWPAFAVPDSVLMKPATDAKHVWFGSRDGNFYCLNRRDGSLAWKKELGSPIVTAPALAGCPTCGHSSTLYVAASNGKVFCLDPDNGQEYWAYEMPSQLKPELLSSPRLFAGNGNRRLYFGAVHTIDGSSMGSLYCLEDRYPWPTLHAHPAKTAGAE